MGRHGHVPNHLSLGCLSGTFHMHYLLFCELSVFDQGISSGCQVFLAVISDHFRLKEPFKIDKKGTLVSC